MKAIILKDYGAPETLQLAEIARPVPGPGEVLVRVQAAAVNHLDIGIAAGAFREHFPIEVPWIPGIDFAGSVEAFGFKVNGFSIGDEIYGVKMGGGSYAEYMTVDAESIALKSKKITPTEAASVPVSALTAWQVLFRDAGILKGQTILIHGAAGAVGAFAIQFAHQAGVKVLVTASERDAAWLKSLGADQVIDRTGSFETAVSGLDAVIDLVGKDLQQRSYPLIREGGVLISVNQPVSEELAAKYKIRAIFSQMESSQEQLNEFTRLIDAGKLAIHPGNVYPLEQAAAAWNELLGKPGEKGHKNGRVVLEVGPA